MAMEQKEKKGAIIITNADLKALGTFSKCPQIYIKLTGFKDNGSRKIPIKYDLLRCFSFWEMSKNE